MPTRSAIDRGDVVAACDRLAGLLSRALELDARRAPADADAVRLPLTRFALSLLRMRVRPALDPAWLATDPVHLVMFGGTNSGKSTVLNLMLGRPAAGMSARARFSQHPEAYRLAALGNRFLDAFPSRFAGYYRYQDRHPPRQEDSELRSDGYHDALAVNDPMRLAGPALAAPISHGAVLWDVPDFSTEEAQFYLPAVFNTIALSDLVVMTVTRENYADHRGGLLRAMICDAGIPLRVVANKLQPGSDLLRDIQRKLGGDGVAVPRMGAERFLPLPQVDQGDELGVLASLLSTPEGELVRRAVGDDLARNGALKQQALASSLDFLERRLDEALAPLWSEVRLAESWHKLVDRVTASEFDERYRREYLGGEKYVDFNQTLVKLMDLLEIPGLGPIFSTVSRGLRAVSRFVIDSVIRGFKSVFLRAQIKPVRGPELETVALCFENWIERLRSEAQIHAEAQGHPEWRRVAETLGSAEFLEKHGDSLGAAYHRYRADMDRITTERALALYELISKRPALLNTLRGIKVTLDVGTTALLVSSGGLNWTDAVVGPLVAPVQRLILEFGLDQYMHIQKSQLKQEQLAAFRAVVEGAMVAPVRAVFHGAVERNDLERARRDLETVRQGLGPLAERRALAEPPR
jgi:hypothetical protein